MTIPRSVLVVLVLALVTGVLGIAAVLAPVDVDDPVLTWPRAGEAPTSTVVPLVPYRPLELRADVPCAALAAVDGEVLRTLPSSVDSAFGAGLVVAAMDGTVTIDSSGERLLDEEPAAGCSYSVVADAAGTRVLRDGAVVVDRPGLLPPQVAQFETGAEGLPEAAGLAVELRTDARYQSTPTPLKIALLVGHGLAFLALLVVAWRTWPGCGPGLARPRPHPADAVVLAVSAAWTVLGPMNIDDAWYTLMARGAGASGYIGNYIYQFNVTENPFVLAQYLMQSWGQVGGWSLLWLRMLPLLYSLVTYLVLRVLLATVLGRAAARGAPWALALAHLLWFLPYGITLRPETVIVVLSAVVWLLTELARRRESIGALAAATAVAAVAMTVSPTALVAVAPLVLALPWLVRWLRVAPTRQRVAAGLLAAACATAIVPVGFADATLGDVRESVAVHRWYYRQYAWYAEFEHYATLLAAADTGAWGKRLPVLLTLAMLVGALLAVGRSRGTGGPTGRLLAASALVTALGLASLALTPTKWVNHFGALAAPATVLLAVALLRSPLPRRPAVGVLAIGTAAAVAAAAVSFAGPNLWRPFSGWGQPFGDHSDLSTPFRISETAPGFGPLELRNPLLWLGVVALAVLVARRRRGLTPDRAVLGVAAGGGVVLMLLVFTAAPLTQAPGPSVASVNLRGGGCGFAESVTVLDSSGPGLGTPIGTAVTSGDLTAGSPPDRDPVPAAPEAQTWHGDIDGGDTTGEVVTPWHPIPDGDPSDAIIVSATGDLRGGQEIALEFDTGETHVFPGADVQEGWIDQPFVLGDLPARPTMVRAVARDTLAGDDTWLAISEPRLAVARSVPELTAGAPVFADQVSAVLWPCVDQIEIRDGLAEAPAFRLRAGDGLEADIERNAFFPDNGGTLVGVDRTARFVELPSALDPPGGAPMQAWGHVDRVAYDHPPGVFDLAVGQTRRDGWTRLPTLVGPDYTGRIFIG